jgi:hypothetical protein
VGMTEKLSYEAEARAIGWFVHRGDEPGCTKAVLALVDKARQEQAEECAKHHCVSDVGGGAACSACDWKHPGHMSQPWQTTWGIHIAALGRK